MAVISPNSFDPVRRYVSVRLAQGVPLVDADWNESEDIRRFELRAFVRWFVGDGVPFGNDGFRIEGVSALGDNRDFRIKAGGAAAPLAAGRMFVDGLEAFILADTNFTAQSLHASQAGSAALAARWGVPVVPAIVPANTPLIIYLDVWERLVTPTEDATLILAGLGTESCSRLKREWAVRVRPAGGGSPAPQAGDPDFIAGHSYAVLARVERGSTDRFNADTIVDRRRTGLQVQSRRDLEQVMFDAFGSGYTIDGTGTPRLNAPIRDVLNGMLRERPAVTKPITRLSGQVFNVPIGVELGSSAGLFWVRSSGPDRFFASGTALIDGTATIGPDLFQVTGVLSVSSIGYAQLGTQARAFYTGQAGGSVLFSRRRDALNVWQPPEVVGNSDADSGVSVTRLPDGSAQVAWTGMAAGTPGIPAIFTRNFPASGGAPGAIAIIGTVGDIQARVAILPGPQAVVFEQSGATLSILTKTFAGGAWPAAWTTIATMPSSAVRDLSAAYIDAGRLWLSYVLSAPGGTQLFGRIYEAGVLGEQRQMLPPGGTPRFPNVVLLNGNPSIFFQEGNALRQVSFVTQV